MKKQRHPFNSYLKLHLPTAVSSSHSFLCTRPHNLQINWVSTMQSDYILIFQTFVPCLDSPMYLPSKEGYEKITGDIGWYVHSETTFRQHHLSGVTGSTIFTWAKWGHIKSCFSWIMQRTWCTADAVCMRAVNTWSAVWAENPRWMLPAADTQPAGTELTFLLL